MTGRKVKPGTNLGNIFAKKKLRKNWAQSSAIHAEKGSLPTYIEKIAYFYTKLITIITYI
jgi:hypothetical protein